MLLRSHTATSDLFPYEPFAPRVWELRENLPAYDAWYGALAEALGAKLAGNRRS